MQHRIPSRKNRIIIFYFTHYPGCIDKKVDNNLEKLRNVDFQCFFSKNRAEEQYQGKKAESHIFKVPCKEASNSNQYDQNPQDRINAVRFLIQFHAVAKVADPGCQCILLQNNSSP